MSTKSRNVLFLSYESPWPAFSGAALRALGLLKELNRAYSIEMILLTRKPLTSKQRTTLEKYAETIVRVALRDVSRRDKIRATVSMSIYGYPYHNAVLYNSLDGVPDVLHRIITYPGVVFTNVGHWGSIVRNQYSPNWVLNQCDAEVDFWRVYASQAMSTTHRILAWINYQLAKRHFPPIYNNVGRIISVCEEDRQLTRALAPNTPIDVIENGVDCSYFTPRRAARTGPPRLLFTGTSAPRNVTALRGFVRNIFPLVKRQLPDTELLVAGNFSPAAQAEFADVPNIRFTGRVDDIRPYFDQGDVYIAPFAETHGSKLKIAEAMAMAMPIVSTPQGVRGFALVDGESVLIARNNNEFAEHVISLIKDPAHRKQLGENAREVALATIDWPVLGRKLIRIVQKTVESLETT